MLYTSMYRLNYYEKLLAVSPPVAQEVAGVRDKGGAADSRKAGGK
jgi:hypothetical protein